MLEVFSNLLGYKSGKGVKGQKVLFVKHHRCVAPTEQKTPSPLGLAPAASGAE